MYFEIEFGNEYPIRSPIVRHLTTRGCPDVRLHPNLYGNGKVCLSILGTWEGEPWSPSMNLMTILMSIQSLLCKDPLTCEPGREEASQEEFDVYNRAVEYECWNLGICQVLENLVGMSSGMYRKVCEYFVKNTETYLKRLESKEKKSKILRHMYGNTIEYYGPFTPRLQLLAKKLT